MRLTATQRQRLRAIVGDVFGPDARPMLFGSRIDDIKQGGDFDVFVETQLADARELVRKKLECLARLHATREFEGEKIDLVIASKVEGAALPIHQIARREGIPL